MAVGLFAAGFGSALLLALAARTVDVRSFAVFATWWTLASLLGLAFVGIEAYLPRPLLMLRQANHAQEPLLAGFTRAIAGAVLIAAVLLLALGPWLLSSLLGGKPWLLTLLLGYMAVMALQSLQRGIAIGRERFTVITWQLVTDGLLRTAGALLLAGSDRASATAFAAVALLGATAGAAAAGVAGRDWWYWRRSPAGLEMRPWVLVTLASFGPLVVNNVGVPWLAVTDAEPRAVGAVAGALTLSRIPTLLVGAAYGPVLAPLSAAADEARTAVFRRLHRRAALAAALLTLVFAAGFAGFGPILLHAYLGPGFRLSRLELAAMACGSGIMFVCVVEQAALVALSRWTAAVVAWAAAVLAFAGVLFLPFDPVPRVALAVCVAPLLAACVMSVLRARAERTSLSCRSRDSERHGAAADRTTPADDSPEP
jgi:O-antigen/teichoic acid export membrane protein